MNEKELKKELDLVNAIKLGFTLGKLSNEIDYGELVAFIDGKTNACKSFDRLKPLFDDFGYLVVKQAIIICNQEPQREELEHVENK